MGAPKTPSIWLDIWMRINRRMPYVTTLKLLAACGGRKLVNWQVTKWMQAMDYHQAQQKRLYGLARVFLGYEHALESNGRDSQEFVAYVTSAMAESIQLLSGTVPPRVAFHIYMENPKEFPLDHLRCRAILLLWQVTVLTKRHAIPAVLAASVMANLYWIWSTYGP